MKFICTQENLNHGLFIVSHIPSRSIHLPILNNVLLKAENKTIILSSTNLEIGISCIIRGKVEEEGDYTVDAKLFSEYVHLLPKENVEVKTINEKGETSFLSITCKNYTSKIKGLSASDFPLIPKIKKENPVILPISEIRKAFSQVIFSVSTSETRPELNGVYCEFSSEKIIIAATDSFRLSEKNIVFPSSKKYLDTQLHQKIIIPSKTIQELLRIINSFKDSSDFESREDIEIYTGENQILFSLGSVEIISRLIEGKFPDYQQIIPNNFSTEATITVSEFLQAIKTASLFTRSGIFDIHLQFLPEDNEVVVSSENTQIGEGTTRIGAKIQGKKNSIILNFRYLLDGLQNIDSEEVILKIIDNSHPCILQPKSEEAYIYIVMPIKQ